MKLNRIHSWHILVGSLCTLWDLWIWELTDPSKLEPKPVFSYIEVALKENVSEPTIWMGFLILLLGAPTRASCELGSDSVVWLYSTWRRFFGSHLRGIFELLGESTAENSAILAQSWTSFKPLHVEKPRTRKRAILVHSKPSFKSPATHIPIPHPSAAPIIKRTRSKDLDGISWFYVLGPLPMHPLSPDAPPHEYTHWIFFETIRTRAKDLNALLDFAQLADPARASCEFKNDPVTWARERGQTTAWRVIYNVSLTWGSHQHLNGVSWLCFARGPCTSSESRHHPYRASHYGNVHWNSME